MRPRFLLPALLAALAFTGAPVKAQDFSWSAFGTIGYAQSNRDYRYQRSIDDNGTLERDSVFGAQGDLRFGPQWSATVQLKLAPSTKEDDRFALTPAWAFLAWRPGDDWLLRAGRLRVPLYLHSEAMDVGVTHDMARLPAEMYSLAPTTDFDGLAIARTWVLGERELAVDAYTGRTNAPVRFWHRDGVPGQLPAGARYADVDVRSTGLVLTWRGLDGVLRGGVHRTRTRPRNVDGVAVRYPFVAVAPGIGYYQVSDQLPGPGVERVSAISNTVLTLGVDQQLVPGWRVAAEYARNRQFDTEMGSNTSGGYVALFHSLGRFTPYASYGRLRSSATALDWYDRLTASPLPDAIPGAAQINGAQRVAAESFYAIDQRTVALGSSFAVDAEQKIKFEWQRTHVGRVSRLVDAPAGQPVPNRTSIDVWSVNYSFSF